MVRLPSLSGPLFVVWIFGHSGVTDYVTKVRDFQLRELARRDVELQPGPSKASWCNFRQLQMFLEVMSDHDDVKHAQKECLPVQLSQNSLQSAAEKLLSLRD